MRTIVVFGIMEPSARRIPFPKVVGNSLSAAAFVDVFVKDETHDFCGVLVDYKIVDLLILLVDPSLLLELVANGTMPPVKQPSFVSCSMRVFTRTEVLMLSPDACQ